MENLLNPREVARLLGVSVGTVANEERRGRLPSVRFGTGKAVRYRMSDVEKLIELASKPVDTSNQKEGK